MKTKLLYSETVKNLRSLIKDYVIKSNLKSLVIGVSGGIDSALVCALVKPVADEIGIPLIGRSISIETNKPDEIERAKNIGKCFCTEFKEVDLTQEYLVMRNLDLMEGKTEQDKSYKIRMGNIKARMRMVYLMNLSSRLNGMILGTENLTEYYLGFFTIGGDEVSGYELIQSLWKHEVYDLSEYLVEELNKTDHESAVALNKCILCNATDGLGISDTDLDQILPTWKERHTSTRYGYKEVDEILISYFDYINKLEKSSSPYEKNNIIISISELKDSPVITRYFNSDFKRNKPHIGRNDLVF